MELIPINLKSNDMALNNCLYISNKLARDPNAVVHVKVKGKIIKCMFSQIIDNTNLGASKNLREFLGLDLVNTVKVEPAQPMTPEKYGMMLMRVELSVRKNAESMGEYSQKLVIAHLRNAQTNTVFNLKQSFYIKVNQVIFEGVATRIVIGGKQKQFGLLVPNTILQIFPAPGQTLGNNKSAQNSSDNASTSSDEGNSLFRADFSPQKMGIGGLDSELFNIFRRTFASRRFSNQVVDRFGVQHVKGILLYGPPGTGKTLIARQLAKALNIKPENLKIVNGPQIFSKFVGESEENIRKLFIAARDDQKKFGPKSPLHIIVFDQIDAICKQRGIYSGGTNVNDQVVNQLLSNIDGVEALNNIIVIGMTNRKDLLDEAILRPGRFQVHIEVSLPDFKGRQQILNIHTAKLRSNNLLHPNANLEEIAQLTKNYTGAELESLIKSAASYAIARSTNLMDFSAKLIINQAKLKVQKEDFLKAIQQIKPQFGIDEDKFNSYFRQKVVNYGGSFDDVSNQLQEATKFSQNSSGQIKSVLLYGPSGTGKTTFAVNFAKHCPFPYIKIISPQIFVSQTEASKVHTMNKIFQDAYKTNKACIVIDNIQRLIEYTAVGRRFSNNILQTLLVMINKIPPNSQTKLLIIATTSNYRHMSLLDIPVCFTNTIQVPSMKQQQISTFVTQKYNVDARKGSEIGRIMNGASIRNVTQVAGLVQNLGNVQEWSQFYDMLVNKKGQSDL